MNKKTAKLLCSVIPISSWRKKVREKLIFRYVLSDLEREKVKRERALYSKVMDSVDDTFVCIDCGANTGQETLPWAEKGAEVHAFEPHPACFKVLKERVGKFSKVHLYEKGVWHKNSTMNLYLEDGLGNEEVTQASSLLKLKQNVSKEEFIEVEIIDLVEFINSLGKKVDLVKVDIEGAEVELIQKIIDTKTYERIGLIVVETHERIPEIAPGIDDLRNQIAAKKINNIDLDWR